MLIRLAVACDLDDIKSCAVAAYSKYVERIGKPPAPMVADFAKAIADNTVSVLWCEDEFTGFVVNYPINGEMHLENVAVRPEHLGKGYGKSLIMHVEALASAQNMPSVNLYTNEAMYENLLLYPALGYKEYNRCTEAGFNRVYFRKVLVALS